MLQEGPALTGYVPHTERRLVEGDKVWFNGVVRSKETVIICNVGATQKAPWLTYHPPRLLCAWNPKQHCIDKNLLLARLHRSSCILLQMLRLAEVINKKQDMRVVSVTVKPTLTNCSGTIWFTDLMLQEGRPHTPWASCTEPAAISDLG